MRVIGAGWVSTDAYGAVQKQIRNSYADDLYPSLKAEGIFAERVKNFGRFDPQTRRAFCAAALALHDADFPPSTSLRTGKDCQPLACASERRGKSIGLIGTGSEESTEANQTYFSDYVDYGRKLARANLFIYTLPTSPLAEIAIHFKLDGPLFYTSAHFLRTASGLLTDGDTSHILALWSEKDFTAALLLSAEETEFPEELQTVETPEQLIDFLMIEKERI